MNHPYRKIVPFILLTLTGVYSYYYAREFIAKWAFAHQSYFAADELILIAVAQADLTTQTAYLLNEGEFEWQGQMVDVLHREVRLDTVYVYGFRDEVETKLKQEAAWLYQDTAQPDKLPNPRTKQVNWESTINPPYRTRFWYVASGMRPVSQSAFSYISPRSSLPYLEVACPPPNP